MTAHVVRRPPRIPVPAVPSGEVVLPGPPPALNPSASGAAAWLPYAFPLVGCGGALTLGVADPRPIYLMGGGLLAAGSLVMGAAMYRQQRAAHLSRARQARRRHRDHLARAAAAAVETARRQRRSASWRHPAPERLWALARSEARVWERRRSDEDFLEVRIGVAARPLATPMRIDHGTTATADHDPLCLVAAQRLVERHRTVDSQPVTVALASTALMALIGDPAACRAVARSIVCQLATLHSYQDLRLGVCAGPPVSHEWEWTKWLPHLWRGAGGGDRGALRFATRVSDVRAMLEEEEEEGSHRSARGAGVQDGFPRGAGGLGAPAGELGRDLGTGGVAGDRGAHLVVVVDGASGGTAVDDLVAQIGSRPVSVLHVAADGQAPEPVTATVRARVDASGRVDLHHRSGEGDLLGVRGDRIGPRSCEALARSLAPLRLPDRPRAGGSARSPALADLLDLRRDRAVEPRRGGLERAAEERLRVPLGVDDDGEPLVLDLKEPALGGTGPHGLVVGATGSGKSELLRTLVTALAVTHRPEELGFVLVDFKGGATFAPMAELPHVAGMITNLEGDLSLVDRMHAALFGEQLRRQELLRRAGDLASINEYNQRRANGAGLEPLPHLMVIVDEFGELLASRPDFIGLFVAIGRVGRSLGMHLVLASQQLDEGRLRGLEGHLGYRICLRVFSPIESRAALGVPDAHHLPAAPGWAYLRSDAGSLRRFRVATASGVPSSAAAAAELPTGIELFTPAASGAHGVAATADRTPPRSAGQGSGTSPTASPLAAVLEDLRGAGPRAHQVWLPPLERALTLDRLLPGVRADRRRGLAAAGWPAHGSLRVPVGLVDRPTAQVKEVLVCDFAGAAGHLAVVGAPQSGKSSLLRTLIVAFALTHTPAEAQFHCVDLGGGGLGVLAGLPHVGTVSGRSDPERIRRVVGETASLLDRRERLMRGHGLDSIEALRARRAAGELASEAALPDIFLVVDSWAAVRQDFPDLEPAVAEIAARGLGLGLHVVITANRWTELRGALRDSIGGRLELRLNDPAESECDRRAAAALPAGVPGRGLTPGRLQFQAALPRLDGRPSVVGVHGALEMLVERAVQDATGPAAPAVRVLPRRLLVSELPPDAGRAGVPIGVGEPDLGTVCLDPTGPDPHLLVFGDGEAGKTNLLRCYLSGLDTRFAPGAAAAVVVDYRRTLLDAVPAERLVAYAGAAPAAREAVARLRQVLDSRLPGADLTATQLRERSWWTGPEIHVVVDDYDLVVTQTDNPLLPLIDYLPQGRDLGLHLVVARRTGGASRALYEPLLQRLRDLGSPGLLLSGDRQEGALLGPHHAGPQPPGRGLLVRRGRPPVLVQTALVAATPAAG